VEGLSDSVGRVSYGADDAAHATGASSPMFSPSHAWAFAGRRSKSCARVVAKQLAQLFAFAGLAVDDLCVADVFVVFAFLVLV
jgi:hypothetical protein